MSDLHAAERERFEAWAKREHPCWRLNKNRRNGGYQYTPTSPAWKAWQAALSAPAAPAVAKDRSHAGPEWSVSQDGRHLHSDHFHFDAMLKLSGDFADDQQRKQYAESLAAKLNAPDAAPSVAPEPVAWMHHDGRVITAETKASAMRDGGAMKSSTDGYSIPLHPPRSPLSEDYDWLSELQSKLDRIRKYTPESASGIWDDAFAECLGYVESAIEAAIRGRGEG